MSASGISLGRRNRILAAAVTSAVAMAAPSVGAGVYTWKAASTGTQDWNTNAPWTPTSPATNFPNAAGDVANLNVNIAADTTIRLNQAITIGSLTAGDGTSEGTPATFKAFTVDPNGGVLIFDNGAANSVLGTRSGNASPIVNLTLNTDLQLKGSLDLDAQHSSSDTTNNLVVNGGVSSAAASGTQTINLQGSLSSYGGMSTWNGAISNGGTGGTIALRQWGTTVTTLAGANTYTGGTGLYSGTLRGIQTAGTPLGTGDVMHRGGTINLRPNLVSAGTDVALGAASAAVGSTYSYGRGSTLSLERNGNQSVALTLGNGGAAANSVLQRSGKGTLTVQTSTGGVLGTNEKVVVNGGVATIPSNGAVNSIVSPSIIGLNGTTGDFLTYGGANGLQNATYSAATDINSAETDAVYNAASGGTNTLTAAKTILALRSAGQTVDLNGQNLGVTSGGIILNGGTIQSTGGGDLAFGGAEAIIHTPASATISSPITGTGGLTKSGAGSLTLTGNNGYSGTTTVLLGGTLNLNSNTAPGTSTIAMEPEALVRLGNGVTIANDIVITGGAKPGGSVTGNHRWFRPRLRGGDYATQTASTVGGVISSSGVDQDVYGVGAPYVDSSSYLKLTGNNTFSGPLRVNQAVVIAGHNNAFGTTDGTQATGVSQYTTATVGLTDGVTITNERLDLAGASRLAIGHIVALGPTGGTWNGPISWASSTRAGFGAEANTKLTIGTASTLLPTVAGINKLGPGIVEIAAEQPALGSGTVSANTYVDAQAGTLLLNNPTGSALGHQGIRVSGGTVAGTGSIAHSILVTTGALAPGDPTAANTIGTFTLSGTSTKNLSSTPLGTLGAAASSGSLSVAAAASVILELSSAAADKVVLGADTRAATIDGAIQYSVPGATFAPAANTVFDLIVANAISYQTLTSGDLATSVDNLDEVLAPFGYTTRVTSAPVAVGEYRYYIAGDAVALSGFSADALRVEFGAPVPEPTGLGLLALGGLGLLRRRRRA